MITIGCDDNKCHRSEISTDKLFLMVSNMTDIEKEWDSVDPYMVAMSFHEYLCEIMSEMEISVPELGNRTLLSRSFTYQICSGERVPTRDIIFRIALSLCLGVDKTRRLLKLANRGELYPKVKRDALIIFALNNNYDLYKTHELLAEMDQEGLV